MKLTEMFISRMEGFADEPLCIYQVYTSKGCAGTLVLKGADSGALKRLAKRMRRKERR